MLRNVAYGDLLTTTPFPLTYEGVWTVTHLTSSAVQDAVDAANAAGGGTVYLPPGVYKFSETVTLPRTWYNHASYLNGQGAVRVIGAGRLLTHCRADAGVMALFAWEAATTERRRTMNQRISGMTLRPAFTDLAEAIHYDFDDVLETGDTTAELWQGELSDLSFEGRNEYNDVLVNIEGNVHNSKFEDIWGNPSVGADTYTTLLFKFDRGADEGSDIGGVYDSTFSRIYAGFMNGGRCALFDGRLVGCKMSGVIQGIAVKHRPAIAVYNGAGSVIEGLTSEGHVAVETVLLNNCRRVAIRGGTLGNMVEPYAAIQTFKLVASRGCRVEDIAYWPAPTPGLSTLHAGFRRVTLDADSHNNFIEVDIGNTDTLANSITDAGNDNRIRVFCAQTGVVETSP